MSFARMSERSHVVPLMEGKRQKKPIAGPESKHQRNGGIARKRTVNKELHEKEALRARMEQSLKFRAPPQSTRPPSPPPELTPAERMRLKLNGPERVNPALAAPRVHVLAKPTAEDLESPLKVSAKSGLYVDEKSRFSSPKADELLRVEREKRAAKQNTALHRKAVEMQKRDDDRYARMAEDKRLAKEQEDKLRESGKALRNRLSMPYNPITLAYADGLDGQRLKHVDDTQKYRAQMRQLNLQQRMTGTHNPITGTPQRNGSVPQRPATPPEVKAAHAKLQAQKHRTQMADAETLAALPQRRYGRRPNPYLDADGLAAKYGAHFELKQQLAAKKQAAASPAPAHAPANSAPAAAAAAAAPSAAATPMPIAPAGSS